MFWNLLVVIIGLGVFETISSMDNAVVNAHILQTMPEKYRRIFLVWGLLFAVFIVRGILPLLIVWLANPALSPWQALTATFSGDPNIVAYIDRSKPFLLLGGGVYLFLVFLSWLFLEEKNYAFLAEGFIHRQGAWFCALTSVFTVMIVYISLRHNPFMALAATIGVSVFFIADGFKRNSEEQENKIVESQQRMSAWSKILYLEILDASFSVDGVVGAFAFTVSVPLIIIGNGLGAWLVREMTVKGINTITKFAYLKNGAMYAVGFLGCLMILESFGHEFSFWLAPASMILLLGLFLGLSILANRREKILLSKNK